MSNLTLSWPERFALIDHYAPSDTQICTTFGLSEDELMTARQLRAAGTFAASNSLNVSEIGNVFTMPPPSPTTAAPSTKVHRGGATAYARPETASKRVREPQKRGRKGNKIATALAAVPTTQTPVDVFTQQHDVSVAVLRQSKRFIERLPVEVQRQIGRINVRQDPTTRKLMIWRDQP